MCLQWFSILEILNLGIGRCRAAGTLSKIMAATEAEYLAVIARNATKGCLKACFQSLNLSFSSSFNGCRSTHDTFIVVQMRPMAPECQ